MNKTVSATLKARLKLRKTFCAFIVTALVWFSIFINLPQYHTCGADFYLHTPFGNKEHQGIYAAHSLSNAEKSHFCFACFCQKNCKTIIINAPIIFISSVAFLDYFLCHQSNVEFNIGYAIYTPRGPPRTIAS
jgi:hypothetical protein